MTTKKKSDNEADPFADEATEGEEFVPASEKTPEEAGVQAPVGGSALSPVIDVDGNPTNFPPITNRDAAPWDPDIPSPGEPQVYGRGNIEAAKARAEGADENAYKGVPRYQEGTLNPVSEDQITSHLGGLSKDGEPVDPETGEPYGTTSEPEGDTKGKSSKS